MKYQRFANRPFFGYLRAAQPKFKTRPPDALAQLTGTMSVKGKNLDKSVIKSP